MNHRKGLMWLSSVIVASILLSIVPWWFFLTAIIGAGLVAIYLIGASG